MKRFKFGLQSVLGLKEKTQENEKMLLYDLKAQMSRLVDELHTLEGNYKRYAGERNELSARGISVAGLEQYCNYLKELEVLQKQKLREIEKLQERIEKQIELLTQISIEVKSLEKLREAQYREYSKLADKETERMIDDFIAARA